MGPVVADEFNSNITSNHGTPPPPLRFPGEGLPIRMNNGLHLSKLVELAVKKIIHWEVLVRPQRPLISLLQTTRPYSLRWWCPPSARPPPVCSPQPLRRPHFLEHVFFWCLLFPPLCVFIPRSSLTLRAPQFYSPPCWRLDEGRGRYFSAHPYMASVHIRVGRRMSYPYILQYEV